MKHQTLSHLLNDSKRITTLSTINADGTPNAAVIGSAYLAEEDRVWVTLGNNRTAQNLKSNTAAVLLVMQPGESALNWQGARLYLTLIEIKNDGEQLAEAVKRVEQTAGPAAARRMHQLAIFQVNSIRPLYDIAGVA